MARLISHLEQANKAEGLLIERGIDYRRLEDEPHFARFNIKMKDLRLLIITQEGYHILKWYTGTFYGITFDGVEVVDDDYWKKVI